MKTLKGKISLLIISFLALFSFSKCVENHVLPDFGVLEITTDPIGVDVYLNGEKKGKTPLKLEELLEDTYTIRLTSNDFIDSIFTQNISGGDSYNFDVFMKESDPKGKITLTTNPSGANVTLKRKNPDGLSSDIEFPQKITPATYNNLERGIYTVLLEKNLYEPVNFEIDLSKDEEYSKNTKLAVVGTAGGIFVNSNPNGADIYINGVDENLQTPDTLYPLPAGDYNVTLSLENYRDTTISVAVTSGIISELNVELTFYEPRGSITLDSNPQGARIFLDNEDTQLFTPAKLSKLKGGDYSIRLELDNYYDTTFTVTVIEDQNTTVPIIELVEIPVYTITAAANPSEAASISGAGDYKAGETVEMSFQAANGYRFINWTENGTEVSDLSVYSFTATRNRNLIANFEPIGNLIVDSDPQGAEIFINNLSTGEFTPHSFQALVAGDYNITLKLQDFADTTFAVNIPRGQTAETGSVYLRDITPDVDVTISHAINSNNQLVFTFSFNQAIRFEILNATLPDDSGNAGGQKLPSFSFGNQLLPEGIATTWTFAEEVKGVWTFEFIGTKVDGRQFSFQVQKFYQVP